MNAPVDTDAKAVVVAVLGVDATDSVKGNFDVHLVEPTCDAVKLLADDLSNV